MILADYPLKDEVVEAMVAYERDTKSSLNTLVEDFLEDFLIKKEYLRYEIPIDEIKTPAEIRSERKNQFTKSKWEDNCQVKFKDLNFGSFKQEIANDVIDKLSQHTDDELNKLSKSNWKYSTKYYRDFLLAWLDDNDLTPEEFIKSQSLINKVNYHNRGHNYTRHEYNNMQIALFNHDKFSHEDMDLAYSYLCNQSPEQLMDLNEKRKKSKEQSGKFILKRALDWKLNEEENKSS